MKSASLKELGYGSVMGFVNGGSVSNWEDLEDSANHVIIGAIDGIFDGLNPLQKSAMLYYHGLAVFKSNRVDMSEVYEEAIAVVERVLKKRGLL